MVSRVGSNQFTRRLKLQADKLEANMGKIVKEAATAFLEVMVLHTRVDTGKARSNWIVTTDAPNIGVIDPYFPYKKHSHADGLGAAEQPNAAAALAAGAYAIDSFRIGVDTDLFITNNVPYLRYIPDGEVSDVTREAADAARQVLRTAKLL